MRRVMVRYKVKPDRAADNEHYIKAVVAQLDRDKPDGIRYATFRQDDGVSFVHIASVETADGANPLTSLGAFQEFTAPIKDRCEEPPVTVGLVAGAAIADDSAVAAAPPRVVAGAWLAETLAALRTPAGLAAIDPGDDLRAELRPYQAVGAHWLYLLARLGLGACLADDMGLGKTMQIIALLLVSRRSPVASPHVLVAPASLLGNWMSELGRFAPSLRAVVAHPSAMPAAQLAAARAPDLAGVDLVITSYGDAAARALAGQDAMGPRDPR